MIRALNCSCCIISLSTHGGFGASASLEAQETALAICAGGNVHTVR
jgi:hypothetical protein